MNSGSAVNKVTLDGKVDRTLRVEFGALEKDEVSRVRVWRGEDLFWEGVSSEQYDFIKGQADRNREALVKIEDAHNKPGLLTTNERKAVAYDLTREALRDRLDLP